MKLNLRHPRINGRTTEEQLAQIKAYLFELVTQLNLIIENLPKEGKKDGDNIV